MRWPCCVYFPGCRKDGSTRVQHFLLAAPLPFLTKLRGGRRTGRVPPARLAQPVAGACRSARSCRNRPAESGPGAGDGRADFRDETSRACPAGHLRSRRSWVSLSDEQCERRPGIAKASVPGCTSPQSHPFPKMGGQACGRPARRACAWDLVPRHVRSAGTGLLGTAPADRPRSCPPSPPTPRSCPQALAALFAVWRQTSGVQIRDPPEPQGCGFWQISLSFSVRI